MKIDDYRAERDRDDLYRKAYEEGWNDATEAKDKELDDLYFTIQSRQREVLDAMHEHLGHRGGCFSEGCSDEPCRTLWGALQP